MPRRNHRSRRRGPAAQVSQYAGASASRRLAQELISLQVRRGVLEPQVESEPVGRAPIEVERAKPGRVRAIVRDGSFVHVVRLRDQVWTCTGCEQVDGVRCRHVEAVRKSPELRRAKRDGA